MTTKLYFVRHGETFLNHFQRMQGWIDSHLTQNGRKQALATGQALSNIDFAVVASSDLGRAQQTKRLILSQLATDPITTLSFPEFREVNFGSFDGLPWDDAWHAATENTPFNDQNDVIADGGLNEARQLMAAADPMHLCEENADVIDRWHRGVKKLLAQAPDLDDMNILVISHGTFIRTIAEYYGQYVAGVNNVPKNGSVTIFSVDQGHIRLERYNQLL